MSNAAAFAIVGSLAVVCALNWFIAWLALGHKEKNDAHQDQGDDHSG